ncbi:ABC transporter substrate-binding protein [Planctomycetota bacterium]
MVLNTPTRVLVQYCLLCAGLLLVNCPVSADDGVREPDIVVGMSTALTGPASDLGLNVLAGVSAAFDESNHAGGVRGRNLALIALDDGYEPNRTAPNMRRLIEQDNVVAVVGNVGTPTAIAAIPIANDTRTLLFGAYSGAGVLRKRPPDRYVVNYRASYAEETAAMVDALIGHAGLEPTEIAFFTQRDGYGDAGFHGGVVALKKHGLSDEHLIAHGRYERNTDLVERGLSEILLHPVTPKAVILVGAYQPCARFIKLARANEFNVPFLNVSFVGSVPLAKSLGSDGEGVIITQVVPHPDDADSQLAQRHREAMSKWQGKRSPSFGSFEGYIVARILIEALDRIEGTVTRENVVDAFELLGKFEVDSMSDLFLSSTDHQASHFVWPTVIRGGNVVPFDWEELSQVSVSKGVN